MICRRRSTPICIALVAPAVPPEPGWPSPSSPTTTRPWCQRLSVRSVRPWNAGLCTASNMPRPGPRLIPTVSAYNAAGSNSVPKPSPHTSGPRQGPAHGKSPQVQHPLRPCQALREEARNARQVDVGNQQRQYVIGGELVAHRGGRGLVSAGDMAGTHPPSRGYGAGHAVTAYSICSRRDSARADRYNSSQSDVWDTCVSSVGLRRARPLSTTCGMRRLQRTKRRTSMYPLNMGSNPNTALILPRPRQHPHSGHPIWGRFLPPGRRR
jgi:hypothetical protein